MEVKWNLPLSLFRRSAETIAFWNRMYGSIDYLWLESKEYEGWAGKELSGPDLQQNSILQ